MANGKSNLIRSRFQVREPSKGIQFDRDEGMAKQSFAAECDINNIMRNYQKTGVVRHVVTAPGYYGDFSKVPDYQTALNTLLNAQDKFMELPSQVRKRFGNDPGEFLSFVADPKNGQALVDMGLAVLREDPAAVKPVVASSPAQSEPVAPPSPAPVKAKGK